VEGKPAVTRTGNLIFTTVESVRISSKDDKIMKKENELLFKRAERIAAQDIDDAYINIQSVILRSKVLKKALNSSELNYHLQKKDYSSNIVNNLDVLTAIQNLEDVRRSYIHTSYESKRFYWQLLAAAGEINPDTIMK
jgi:outer membrane protein TolC